MGREIGEMMQDECLCKRSGESWLDCIYLLNFFVSPNTYAESYVFVDSKCAYSECLYINSRSRIETSD
jgi:hypothetical protein